MKFLGRQERRHKDIKFYFNLIMSICVDFCELSNSFTFVPQFFPIVSKLQKNYQKYQARVSILRSFHI